MKSFNLFTIPCLLFCFCSTAQTGNLPGKEVFKNEDVVFHQIDDHTWIGTGHVMYNESMYLVEGNDKALLIDAGTNIKDLDKIIAGLTKKRVMLVATHVHPDHTGSSINPFPEIYINPADTVQIAQFMPTYKGKVSYLKDGQIIDLGGRQLEVVFTPAHTPGSTTFLDTKAGYGFSGDSFGSGNLLLGLDFSTLIASCTKAGKLMDKYSIKFLYPGHYFGNNPEMRQRLTDMITLSQDVLSGKVKGQANPNGMMGLNLLVSDYGVKINYSEKAVK
jgi:hydroxyacylglutathione hydrolase